MAYSALVMDHFQRPRNAGVMEDANGVGDEENPACGDVARLFLRIEGEIILRASFQARGCPASIAACSVTTEMVRGKTLAEAEALKREDVANALGGLPRGKVHCSVLAADALRNAIQDHRRRAA
ncbi:MAG: iron-sulfur cluster assembly scaffold protein [Dehalococcoidia bacterium]|nr:iron-sulfur cluster assembly scaffold protein [Dehalococcoidia bacterium]